MAFKEFKGKIWFLRTFKDRVNFLRNLRTNGRPVICQLSDFILILFYFILFLLVICILCHLYRACSVTSCMIYNNNNKTCKDNGFSSSKVGDGLTPPLSLCVENCTSGTSDTIKG